MRELQRLDRDSGPVSRELWADPLHWVSPLEVPSGELLASYVVHNDRYIPCHWDPEKPNSDPELLDEPSDQGTVV